MRKPSIPMMLSLLALFFALGGTAIAAKHYLITKTSQIKPSVLKQLRGQAGARGPAGPTGANGVNGANGAQGPQGPAGPTNLGKLVRVEGPAVGVPGEKTGHSNAVCPSGDHVVSGGYSDIFGKAEVFVADTFGAPEIWSVLVFNFGTLEGHITAIAFCAPAGTAIAASRRNSVRTHAEARIEAVEAAELAAKGK